MHCTGNVGRFKPGTAGHDVHVRPFVAIQLCWVRRIHDQVYYNGSLRARGERAKSEARAVAGVVAAPQRSCVKHIEDQDDDEKVAAALACVRETLEPPAIFGYL